MQYSTETLWRRDAGLDCMLHSVPHSSKLLSGLSTICTLPPWYSGPSLLYHYSHFFFSSSVAPSPPVSFLVHIHYTFDFCWFFVLLHLQLLTCSLCFSPCYPMYPMPEFQNCNPDLPFFYMYFNMFRFYLLIHSEATYIVPFPVWKFSLKINLVPPTAFSDPLLHSVQHRTGTPIPVPPCPIFISKTLALYPLLFYSLF